MTVVTYPPRPKTTLQSKQETLLTDKAPQVEKVIEVFQECYWAYVSTEKIVKICTHCRCAFFYEDGSLRDFATPTWWNEKGQRYQGTIEFNSTCDRCYTPTPRPFK